MKKLVTGAIALTLVCALGACNKDTTTPPTGPSSAARPSSAATTPGTTDPTTGTPSDTATDSTTTGTATGTASVTAQPANQSTPELAMTSWLGAMVSGDGKTVCGLMATGGKAISSIPGAAEACGTSITPMLDQVKELGAAFKGLTISGATINGNTASFDSVTTEPALAADVVSSFKAVKIGGKWYITQG